MSDHNSSNMGPASNRISVVPGFGRLATIISVDQTTQSARIKFRDRQLGYPDATTIQLPSAFVSADGPFIGGHIQKGTTVIVHQAESSGNYYFTSFVAQDVAASNKINLLNLPYFNPGDILIRSNTNTAINLNTQQIIIGEPQNAVIFDTYRSLYLNSFDSTYIITQGGKEITGVIKRDVKPAKNFSSYLRSSDPNYDDTLKIIGMDPLAPVRVLNIGDFIRNPARVEKREIVYEYHETAQVQSNDIEIGNYANATTNSNTNTGFINRRHGRDDTLSLSLVAPNYLIETIKGSIVDIFGNLLDLNRNIIPIGQNKISIDQIKTTINNSDTFQNAYQQIKREERKNIAYHFEINARKEDAVAGVIDITKSAQQNQDYARDRSRFSLDIDKEGQLKLNVPASSEYGNVSLLTRYENYSTVNPNPATNNTNDLSFNTNGGNTSTDILIDSFINSPAISLSDNLNTNAAPTDRFTNDYIKHGTVYHDITTICASMQTTTFYVPPEYDQISALATQTDILQLDPIISTEIPVSGKGAMAGGRSASLNFDGSVELNIGANTIDRDSLWMDLQGAIKASIGRDLPNNVSIAASTDGHVLLEVGARSAPPDARFVKSVQNAVISNATVDIRVHNSGGEFSIIRIDDNGITMTTPTRITMVSNGDLTLFSKGKITIDGDEVNIQNRKVIKDGYAGYI